MPVPLHADALLRRRDGHHARVTFVELFFDLVYVFAVTQVSHLLLHHLDPLGALQTLIVWFAVWLGWQYTCWASNWFDPDKPAIRNLMFTLMLLAMLLSAAIPQALRRTRLAVRRQRLCRDPVGAHVAYPLAVARRPRHWRPTTAACACGCRSRRCSGSAARWPLPCPCASRCGPLPSPASTCRRCSASRCRCSGVRGPRSGRSRADIWAERCQLFVIVALGETLLASGASLADAEQWTGALVSALLATFLGTLGMWWLYFATSLRRCDPPHHPQPRSRPDRRRLPLRARHPGGRDHVTAVGNDLILAHPHAYRCRRKTAVLMAGPAIYLLGSAIYKRVVYGRAPRSHVAGVVALALPGAVAPRLDLLMLGWATTAVVVAALGGWRCGALGRQPRFMNDDVAAVKKSMRRDIGRVGRPLWQDEIFPHAPHFLAGVRPKRRLNSRLNWEVLEPTAWQAAAAVMFSCSMKRRA